MEKRVYFIYSNNREKDKGLIRDLHNWLPADIDIIESRVKNNRIIATDKEMPGCLINTKRPIYLAEWAINELIKVEESNLFRGFSSNAKAIECLKFSKRNIAELVGRLTTERKIISGEDKIMDYIDELRRGKIFIY